MPGLPSEVDVAVIGAGAAGIAAGRRLAEAERASFVVIEARERAGGRAWTVEKVRDCRSIWGANGCIRRIAIRWCQRGEN